MVVAFVVVEEAKTCQKYACYNHGFVGFLQCLFSCLATGRAVATDDSNKHGTKNVVILSPTFQLWSCPTHVVPFIFKCQDEVIVCWRHKTPR